MGRNRPVSPASSISSYASKHDGIAEATKQFTKSCEELVKGIQRSFQANTANNPTGKSDSIDRGDRALRLVTMKQKLKRMIKSLVQENDDSDDDNDDDIRLLKMQLEQINTDIRNSLV